jgi:hypothetical protein
MVALGGKQRSTANLAGEKIVQTIWMAKKEF